MDLKKKNILITGAEGFIGSHLTELLAPESSHIRALCKYNSFNDWGWLERLSCLEDIEVVTGDICDPHQCFQLTRGIDMILHLAALIPIPYSYKAPSSYLETNVKGTLNLCQAALASGVERFVHTSTSEVYGTAQYVPIDEKHPLNAQSPYSASKIGADAIVTSFCCSFDMPAVIARPFNSYGPRQSARAIIPTIISQILGGVTGVRLGDVTTTRDFTYVEDTCRGLMAIASLDGGQGEVFNIGSNMEVSVGDLFQRIVELTGIEARIITDESRQRPANSEVMRLWCDNGKLKSRAGFQPSVGIDEGLQRTIQWFRQDANRLRYKEHLYNV